MNISLVLLLCLQLTCNRSVFAADRKNCPDDPKQLQNMVERFEEKEACNRMSFTECGILTGATAAGATVTAAVLAKRLIFLGDSKMPSTAFSCTSSVTHRLWKDLLIPDAYAMKSCTYKPIRTQEEALKKYIELSEKALKEKIEEISKSVQTEMDKGLRLVEGNESSATSTPSRTEVVGSKAKVALSKTLGDSSKAEKAMKLLKNFADSGLSRKFLDTLDNGDRDLLNKATEAYNRMNAQTLAERPAPQITGLNLEAKQELKKIFLEGKDSKDGALNSLQRWSAKYGVSSKTSAELSKSLEQVHYITRRSALFGLYQTRLDQVSVSLKNGSKVTKELLEKMPSLEALQTPKMLELRNFIAAKSGLGILGILDPISAFAESKLMASNVFLRAAGKLAVRAGGVTPNLVFASGNTNFTMDHEKSCMRDRSSEDFEYHAQLVDFDENCNGMVEYDSEKFRNFLALPTINKVELLSKNPMIKNAYCSFLQDTEPSDSYNIECLSAESFSYKSKNGPPVSRIFSVSGSQNGMQITADLDDNYTTVKQCPKSYRYEIDGDQFVAKDGSELSKRCRHNTDTLNLQKYYLVKVSECCQGRSDSFCDANHVTRSISAIRKSTDAQKKSTSGIK